jgi:ketosteroid isomerase-like protein
MRALTTVLLLVSAACATTQGDPEAKANHEARDELLKADQTMSALSSRSGMGTAFAQMYDVDAVSLRNGTLPLRGRDAIVASTMRCAAACAQTWEPQSAEADGNLGYTWGTYTWTHTTPGEPVQTVTGSYVSVWKRDASGWHVTLTSATRDE